MVDVAGHYSRPDVVRLLFDPSPHSPLVTADTPANIIDAPAGGRPARRTAKKAKSR
jgi:hypothetical protein